jgi:Family of unknown function (DUF6152)
MVRPGVSLAAAFSIVLYAWPVSAHHSFAAEYDSNKTISIKGTVAKIAWVNPHAYVYINAKDENGKAVTWAFETLSPNALAIRGWSKTSLKIGEEVTVDGYLAKDGKPLEDGSLHANSRQITTSNGRKVFVGSSAPDAPQ